MITKTSLGHGGYRTAWTGDLAPDLPTQRLPRIDPPDRGDDWASTQPPLDVLRAVLEGLKRL